VGAALTGSLGGGGNSEQQMAAPASQPTAASHGSLNESGSGVCQFELRQFMECSQSQLDLSLCQAFSDALRDCRRANGQ